jgi:hypothetical protein
MKRRLALWSLMPLLLSWEISTAMAQSAKARTREAQKVFTDLGLPHADVVMDIYEGQLRMREPVPLATSASCYLVDGLKYCKDLKEIESNYKTHDIKDKLTIRDNDLFYDGAPILLPHGVQMRLVWQGVLWNGWVICLGRTSESDKPANMTPPFFATELITFSVTRRIAKVKYLSFNPPSDTRIYILDPH